MNAVQDHYACIEGLTMMHMKHAMPIYGGIMHLRHLRCTNSGDQNRCLGVHREGYLPFYVFLRIFFIFELYIALVYIFFSDYLLLVRMLDCNIWFFFNVLLHLRIVYS